jgi:hypothetical protein
MIYALFMADINLLVEMGVRQLPNRFPDDHSAAVIALRADAIRAF